MIQRLCLYILLCVDVNIVKTLQNINQNQNLEIMNHHFSPIYYEPLNKNNKQFGFWREGFEISRSLNGNIASWGNKLCAGNTQANTYGGSKGGRIQWKR